MSQNYSTTKKKKKKKKKKKGLIWPVLFCIFAIVVLPVLLVDNAKYCKQSIVPCYPGWSHEW